MISPISSGLDLGDQTPSHTDPSGIDTGWGDLAETRNLTIFKPTQNSAVTLTKEGVLSLEILKPVKKNTIGS